MGGKWEKEKLNDAPRGVVDEWGHVDTQSAVVAAKAMAVKEGMMVGPSAGAAIKVACDVSCRPESSGKTIVVIVPSHGIRYTQHPLWGDLQAEAIKALPNPPCSDKEQPTLMWESSSQPF